MITNSINFCHSVERCSNWYDVVLGPFTHPRCLGENDLATLWFEENVIQNSLRWIIEIDHNTPMGGKRRYSKVLEIFLRDEGGHCWYPDQSQLVMEIISSSGRLGVQSILNVLRNLPSFWQLFYKLRRIDHPWVSTSNRTWSFLILIRTDTYVTSFWSSNGHVTQSSRTECSSFARFAIWLQLLCGPWTPESFWLYLLQRTNTSVSIPKSTAIAVHTILPWNRSKT